MVAATARGGFVCVFAAAVGADVGAAADDVVGLIVDAVRVADDGPSRPWWQPFVHFCLCINIASSSACKRRFLVYGHSSYAS